MTGEQTDKEINEQAQGGACRQINWEIEKPTKFYNKKQKNARIDKQKRGQEDANKMLRIPKISTSLSIKMELKD